MRQTDLAPDWPLLLDQLTHDAGMQWTQIARAMGLSMLTESMLRSYRAGVQPMYWRGDAIVELWCQKLGKTRKELPMAPVTRGHRMQRSRANEEPRWQGAANLPAWPAPSKVA